MCSDVQQAVPPFKLNPLTNPDRPGQRTNYIMLVDRGPRTPRLPIVIWLAYPCGSVVLTMDCAAVEDDMSPCKFAEKVWNAQEAGAQGVRPLRALCSLRSSGTTS